MKYIIIIILASVLFSSCASERTGCGMAKGFVGTH